MNAEAPLVAVQDLRKRYGGVVALDGMSVEVQRGTIHAIVGENGAGKSTLMKILAGVVRPDSGTVWLDGEAITIESPQAARERGIGIVYQELSLFPQRSVLANLFVNHEPTRYGLISHGTMEAESADMLRQLGLHVDVNAPVGSLTIGEQQLVELCRVLLEEPRLLILDEPNSALNERETKRLFVVLRQLRERGITMLYVSHRLEEVFEIADRVTVTRNGHEVFTRDIEALTIPEVIEGMVGAHQEDLFPPPLAPIAGVKEQRISVQNLSADELRDISFEARTGEIIGLAGLEGSGVSALLGMLFGMQRAKSGKVTYPDGGGLPNSPTSAARRGVCLVPADRKRNGLMLEKSILENIAHVTTGALQTSAVWLRRGEMLQRANRQIDNLRIKTRSAYTLANQLSGGNQQKVVVGKWLEAAPTLVLLDDPTRGVDVGAKREIYVLIRQLAAEGRIVLFSSTELPELIGLCDRIIVLYRGRLVGELSGSEITDRALLHTINTGEMPGK
ncbi:MAG: sugar ABC transporter ATP-binding protein [Burkholderiales bacterium]|nr:sugar ABC transporter ATP-binding protein [Anaerolineae bacterium]